MEKSVDRRPSAERSVSPDTCFVADEPVIRAPPFVSDLMTVMRPDTPRGGTASTLLTVPAAVEPDAPSWSDSCFCVSRTDQLSNGDCSYGSGTPRRYEIGVPPQTFSLCSV